MELVFTYSYIIMYLCILAGAIKYEQFVNESDLFKYPVIDIIELCLMIVNLPESLGYNDDTVIVIRIKTQHMLQ